jgi:DNA-binding NarL/FixJ family response regulator
MSNIIRIILAEDHNLVRAGIKALLQDLSWVHVVAEASNGHEAVQLVKEYQPNIILMDITMPGMNGLEAMRIIKEQSEIKVIMLSMHTSEEYVWQALRAGASGYLLKDAGIAELELSIRAVSQGQSYLSPAVSHHVIGSYIKRVNGEESQLEKLTSRQRQILQLIAEGHTTRQIAEKLNVSFKTAEAHRSRLMNQLNVHDVTGLVRYAIQVGLISSNMTLL